MEEDADTCHQHETQSHAVPLWASNGIAYVCLCVALSAFMHAIAVYTALSAVCLKQQHCTHQLFCTDMAGVAHDREIRQATKVNDEDAA